MANVTAPQFQQDVNNAADWANGDESTTVTMRLGQQADSPAKVIKRVDDLAEAQRDSIDALAAAQREDIYEKVTPSVKGTFEAGFTFEDLFERGKFGAEPSETYWAFTDGSAGLPHVVTAGTDPTLGGPYEQVTLNVADDVSVSGGGSVQGYINKNLTPFNDVAEMRAYDYSSTPEFSRIEWQGYYAQSDGGSNWGVLKKGDSTSLVDDGGSIFVIVNDAVDGVWVEANHAKSSISILKFGAVGGANCDTEINKALESANALSGDCTVTVPPSKNGQPFIFNSLKVYTGTTFKGKGGWLKLADNAYSGTGAYYPINNINETNVVYDGLYVDGNSANNPAPSNPSTDVCDTITCVGEFSKIKNCELINAVDSGIMFSGCKNGYCRYNKVDGARDVCIYVNSSVGDATTSDIEGADVTKNKCFNGVFGAIAAKRWTSDIIIALNIGKNCGNGVTLETVEGGLQYPRRVKVVNNIMIDIGYTQRASSPAERAFGASITDDSEFKGNKAIRCSGSCFYIGQGSDNSVVSNKAIGYPASPSPSATEPNRGYYFGTVTDCDLIANKGRGFVSNAARIDNCTGGIFTGNNLKSISASALRINAPCSGFIAKSNELENQAGGLDLEVFAGAKGILKDNTLLSKPETSVERYGFRTISAGQPAPNLGTVEPFFAGEEILWLNGNVWYKAYGIGSGEWS